MCVGYFAFGEETLYLVLNPEVAWNTRWKFGGWLGLLFVGDLGSVPGFGARLGLDSVISNLETVVSPSLRWSSEDTPLPSSHLVSTFEGLVACGSPSRHLCVWHLSTFLSLYSVSPVCEKKRVGPLFMSLLPSLPDPQVMGICLSSNPVRINGHSFFFGSTWTSGLSTL